LFTIVDIKENTAGPSAPEQKALRVDVTIFFSISTVFVDGTESCPVDAKNLLGECDDFEWLVEVGVEIRYDNAIVHRAVLNLYINITLRPFISRIKALDVL
jgi:hypothetical protein